MRELIKKIVERLYYKCYPDRVNEHEIATLPIPTPIVRQYKQERIIAGIKIPREAYIKDAIPEEFIRKELSIKIAQRLEDQISIEYSPDNFGQYDVFGSIRILKEDQYE